MNDLLHQPTVFIHGYFDNLKTKDIRFLQEASKLGDVHILLFSDDIFIKYNNKEPISLVDERRYYLESIRYVKQVSVIDQKIQDLSLPPTPQLTNTYQQPIWAVLEKDVNQDNRNFSNKNDLKFHVIPDSSLAGFPFAEVNGEFSAPLRKKVAVSGCFDWVHTGHIRFFEEVSEFGDLYVVVGHDMNVSLLKGEGHPMFPEIERLYWVQSIRFVKKAMLSSGHGWLDAAPELKKIKPDMFVVNKDGDNPEKREYFKNQNIEYIVLERKPKPGLPARVSTDLRGF